MFKFAFRSLGCFFCLLCRAVTPFEVLEADRFCSDLLSEVLELIYGVRIESSRLRIISSVSLDLNSVC